MAKRTKKKEKKETNSLQKKTSPFKDIALLEKEITDFANKFRTTVVNQSKRISDYFEMSCFNYIVKYYELNGYEISVENLIKGSYRYKCSPSGVQSNFSHFLASKKIDGVKFEFEIQHNLAIQSAHHLELFATPDISIVKKGTIRLTTSYYETKRRFSFVENEDAVSFCEAKNFNPFPELIFNFMGIINELRPATLSGSALNMPSEHIAPTLMVSGKPNKQTQRIKESLEERYLVNILFDLFYSASQTFSRRLIRRLKKNDTLVDTLPY